MELRKDLGFVHMTALTVSMMLGVGIFFGPTLTASEFPDARVVLLLWLVGGLVALCGAWLFGRLAALYPLSGGPYVYVREGFGPAPAFLFAWTSAVIIAPASTAVMVLVFAQNLSVLSPLSATGVTMMALWSLVAFAFVNVLGVKLGGRVQALAMALKIALLLAVVALLAGLVGKTSTPQDAGSAGGGRLAIAFAGVLFAFGGWDYAVLASEEVRQGSRTIPPAMLLGASLVTALYLLATAAYLLALGPAGVGHATALAAQAAGATSGRAFALVVALGVALSAAGTINAVLLLGPRATFAVGRDGLLPRGFAWLAPRWRTPVVAIALQVTLTTAYVLVGAAGTLAAYTVIGTAAFIVLSTIGLFRLRKRAGLARAGWLEYAAAAVIVAVYSWFTLDTIVEDPRTGVPAALIICAGLVPYALARRRARDS